MATTFLRKIILEELKKVLNEDIPGRVDVPYPEKKFIPQLKSFLIDKARNDKNFKQELQILNLDVASVSNFMKEIYGPGSTYHSDMEKINAFTKAAEEAQRFLPNLEGNVEVPAYTPTPKDLPTYDVGVVGKKGIKCQPAEALQFQVRRSLTQFTSINSEKREAMQKRVIDGRMGVTTLGLINASIIYNKLGSPLPLTMQGFKAACNPKNKVVQAAINQFKEVKPEQIVKALTKETAPADSMVAQANTNQGLAEAIKKELDKLIANL